MHLLINFENALDFKILHEGYKPYAISLRKICTVLFQLDYQFIDRYIKCAQILSKVLSQILPFKM